MGFRFRKSFKIAPGFKINLSKSGISSSFGVKGASVSVGKTGVRANAGLPGTGIGYSKKIASFSSKSGETTDSISEENPQNPHEKSFNEFMGCGCLSLVLAAISAAIWGAVGFWLVVLIGISVFSVGKYQQARDSKKESLEKEKNEKDYLDFWKSTPPPLPKIDDKQ